jgi:hypothetical protein
MPAESEDGMLRSVTLVSVIVFCLLAPVTVLAGGHDPKRIMADEVMEKLNAGEDILFLDTRTAADWAAATSMIPDAIRVRDNATLEKIVRETPKERLIVAYCT